MKRSESIVEIAKALNEFHKKVEQPAKSANNPFFKASYVPLEDVVEAITKAASVVGLSFTQWAVSDETGRVGVATLLMHESGEWIEYPPVMQKPAKPDPQQLGSTITYLKRYTLSAVFGITSDKDDDGEKAMNRNSQGEAQGFQQQRTQPIAHQQQGGAYYSNKPLTPEEKNEIFAMYMTRKRELGKFVNKEDAIAFVKEQESKGYGYPSIKKFVQNMKY